MECFYRLRQNKVHIPYDEIEPATLMGIYIDKEKNIWGVSEDLAMTMVETFENDIESCMIPDSDFVLIYDGDSVFEIAGHKYVFYDCLIMKAGKKGLCAVRADEVEDARKAFRNQTATYQVGPFSFSAYRIS